MPGPSKKQSRAPGKSASPRYVAAAKARLREPFRHLAGMGAPLHDASSAQALHRLLIDGAVELSGAGRVLLVLDGPQGLQLAGAQLPPGEDASALLAAVMPWLAEAGRTRTVRLRHGPDGADQIDQRSCLVAPLVARKERLGFLYADIEGASGRFGDSERNLLAMLASQAATALSRLRATEGLTSELHERTVQLAQRDGELALINSIQQGIAAKLGFQAIVDLVGDRLGEVFKSQDLSIRWWDDQADMLETLYVVEHGRHLPKGPPRPTRHDFQVQQRLLHEGRGSYFGTREEQMAAGLGSAVPGTDWCLSIIGAPIRGSRRVLGFILLEDHQREHAYGEADLRMLTTIGATLGTALENARLFDETQRLLKETEQRNAELAVINSVQQGIAGSLDYQGIVELVGEKLRAVFGSGDLGINTWDEVQQEIISLYGVEHGVRLPVTRRKVEPGGFLYECVVQPKAFVFGSIAEQARAGVPVHEGTDRARSILGAPMLAGDRLLGYVVVENHQHDNAFGEAEVRLLTTVASSMAMALENARLFDETQRNAREASALSEVGRDLSSTLELSGVMDRIAGHAKDLLVAQNSAIFLPDADGTTYRALVALGDLADTLKTTAVERGRGIIGSLIESGRAEFINDTAADARAVPIPGTPLQHDERLMVVPLRSGDEVQGAMAVWRSGGPPFDSHELAFLEGLSQQAVIALNNARLFNETQDALARQTASADILRVISRSPTDVQPVFEAIVRAGVQLFEGAAVAVSQPVGDQVHLRAIAEDDPARVARWYERFPVPLSADYMHGAALLEARVIDVADVADESQPFAAGRHRFLGSGYRAMAVVPMLRYGVAIGAISVIRTVPGALDSAHLELLSTFADQAVIAIENVRLFNETQQALSQQTASADILRVISASPTDTQPVFNAIVRTAVRLLELDRAAFVRVDGLHYVPSAIATPAGLENERWTDPVPIDPEANFPSQGIAWKRTVHLPDWDAIELPERQKQVRASTGARASLCVPLLRGDEAVGALMLFRNRPGGFTTKEIALAESYRDQALIAIENARLFNDTQEALARQTATADVLQVISESQTDVQPVFDIIAERAASLTAARFCLVTRVDGDQLHLASLHGVNEAGSAALRAAWPQRLSDSTSIAARAMRQRSVVNVADLLALSDAEYAPAMKRACELAGFRSGLSVPMMRDQQIVGAITVNRAVTGLYADKEIALLQTFAR
ncbi:MAG: GAF domain-containing protein, partial [Pseudomonadota bacterium]